MQRRIPPPRITAAEYARRRRRLMGMMEPDSIAILPSATEQVRSRDTHFPFRQDSDFHYLTGFDEPDAVLVLVPDRAHGEYVLFCRERHPEHELWEGRRAGPEGACRDYGADDAFPIADIDEILPGLLEGRERVYYSMGRSADFDRRIMSWVNTIRAKQASGAVPPGEFTDLDLIVHDMRLLKSAAEQRLMRRAGEITASAHRRAMRACRPGLYEYQLEAELHHEFAMRGARFPAYPAIVGAGPNACVLHYTENSARLKAGDLVLIDAGCEFDFYAADVTRTFPVSGCFSAEQRALYDIVLEAHTAAVAEVRPGNDWHCAHATSVEVITRGLRDLGLLHGELGDLLARSAHRAFYMHRAGHWLGLDVHDVGGYRVGDAWRTLEPGMALTVEPGIYIPPGNDAVPRKWRGMGIRIEDDVLVTREGNEVLTGDCPRQAREIEQWMAG